MKRPELRSPSVQTTEIHTGVRLLGDPPASEAGFLVVFSEIPMASSETSL